MTLGRLQRTWERFVRSSKFCSAIRLAVAVCVLLSVAGEAVAKNAHQDALAPYRDGIVLLAFQNGIQPSQQDAILSRVGAREIKRIGVGVHVVAVTPGRVPDVVQLLKARREVRFAEPDYLQTVSAASLPNDSSIGVQWAIHNMSTLAAWGVTTGSNSVVVAVLDTGVQYSHPDLFTNMWANPGGIGGCAAGTHGYNILSATCDPMDDDTVYGGHGTHVAGILGAVANNGAGVAGVNWTTSIMAVKWVNSGGTGATSDLISAMDWVVKAKQAGVNVRVINDSQTWPGTAFSQALSDEIILLGSNDILFVTASGNTSQNNDTTPRYPCSYSLWNMICAAASDQNDNLWSSANFGPNTVNLVAPGVNIFSTLRSSNYNYITGGSMASPQVAGTAALILSLGYKSVSDLKAAILNNVDPISSLSGFVSTGGRINVCKAVPGCPTAVAGTLTNSALPVVTSIPQQGGLLGASTGLWNGLPSTYSYQWNRCDVNGLNCSPISGANTQTYALLAPADPLATFAVTVTASNSFGSKSAQSIASSSVSSATSAGALSSSIASGATISGPTNWTITPSRSEQFVQFYIDGVLTKTDLTSPYAFITGNSGSFDTTTVPNGPHVLGARALFTDNRTYDFYGENVTVANPPQNTSLPAISGAIAQGSTISTSSGVWNANTAPTSFSYKWEHCDLNGLNCSIISGATSSNYVLSNADTNFTMRSSATASNSFGSTAAVSAQTAVVPPPPLVITTSSVPGSDVNVSYSSTVAATGGIPPYSWSIASGTLPAGLSIAPSTGVISGVPTASGTSNFTVQVSDTRPVATTKALSLSVAPPPSVTTTSLAVATQFVAYSATLTATSGTPPYSWSIVSGTLPTGLALSSSTGAISGTPTAFGTSNFTVQVTDNFSVSATQALSLNVLPAPGITTTSLPAGDVSASYSATLAATSGTPPYTWSIASGSLPSGLTLAASTGVISGTPASTGTSNFTARVTDSNSITATKALSIAVAPALVITTNSLSGGTENVLYSAALAASGGVLPYTWSIASGSLPGLVLATSTGAISGLPSVSGTSNFTVQVTDANAVSTLRAFSVTINATSSGGGISLVQANATQGTFVGSVSVPFPIANTLGNLIIASLRMSTSTQTVKLSDSAGNTYAEAVGQIQNADGSQVHLFYAKNILGAGTNTVTATFSSTNNHPWLSIFEYKGLNTTNPLDRTASSQGNNAAPSSGATPATTSATELVFSATGLPASFTGTSAAGTGYTLVQSDTGSSPAATESLVVTNTGSYTGTFSLSSSVPWSAVVATFVGGAVSMTTTTLPSATQNASYSQTLAAAGGAPPYTWSITSGALPTGLTLTPNTGVISGTPTGTGTSSFTAQVTDTNSLTDSKALNLVVAIPPTVTTASLPNGTQNASYSTTLAASGGALPYTWTVNSGVLPAGLTLAPGSGVISGTPSVTGTGNFTVQVSDANSAIATQSLSLSVVAPPVVTTTSLPGGTQNSAYSTTLAASGGTPPYAWSIASGTLPPGLSLASSTGVISGTPTVGGTSNFTVGVTDTNSVSATQALSIVVVTPPSVTTASLTSGTQNVAYSATLTAFGGTLPYTWSIASGTLPTGLSLAPSTGVISGTPTATGTSNFTAQVTDTNSLSAQKALSLIIAATPPPTVTTASLPGGTQNVAYSATLTASGGTSPYTWSIASGTLPAGLTLAAGTGVISGTPSGAGTSNFTVQVTDINSLTGTKALSLNVIAPPTVTTASLPGGTQNTAYSATLAATGGTSPYSWSIASGTLPAGLSLAASTGVISGTPTGSGTSNFTVQATDTNSLTGTAALSITIAASSGGGIGLVQANSVQGSGMTSVSVAFPVANSTGNLIIAFVRMSTSTQTLTVTDTAGNTYVEAVAQAQIADGSQVHLFYAKSIPGVANTVTATFSSTNNHPWLAIYEYKGLNASTPLDQIAQAQGNSTTPSSGATPTTTSANELVFAGFGFPASYTGTQAVGAGYTLIKNDTGTSPAANESILATATGSFTATYGLSSSANWSAIVATFKP